MGNECSADERESRYKEFHNAMHIIDNDIKRELINPDLSKKQYLPFGLVSKSLCKKYKFLIDENFDKNEARNKFLYSDIDNGLYRSYLWKTGWGWNTEGWDGDVFCKDCDCCWRLSEFKPYPTGGC